MLRCVFSNGRFLEPSLKSSFLSQIIAVRDLEEIVLVYLEFVKNFGFCLQNKNKTFNFCLSDN